MNLNLIKTLLSVPENQSGPVWTVTRYFEHKDPHLSTGFSSPLRALARVVRFVVVGGVNVDVEISLISEFLTLFKSREPILTTLFHFGTFSLKSPTFRGTDASDKYMRRNMLVTDLVIFPSFV